MEIRKFIKQYLNVPYKWGGTTVDGFDCSGWVVFIYNNFFRKPLSVRTTTQMLSKFNKIDKNQLTLGDLIFFNTIKGPEPDHVGLYIGNGEFTHAGSNGVTIAKLNSSYWRRTFVTARTIREL